MTKERWRQIEEVFQAAVQLDPERRALYLRQTCRGDRELLEEVESLLAIDGQSPDLLRNSIQNEAERLSGDVSSSVIGQRIGPYRVTGVLGRGGMGAVYLAVREDDVYERPVALKVVKRGMDTEEVLRRFRQERRILSRLDHPNIARMLDGGTTEDGRPYFVMENVAGEPITGYAAGMPPRDRLNLFRQVCDAVEYAHRNLVVHRDLKPGNILVTAEGVPKLLDFGIAKLLTPDDTGQTLTGMRILTPDYASPEQKRGEPVTTASDVYSLGRVLEKLLCGGTLNGELRQIVEMARHEDIVRRYASVAEFSDDIRRYLEGLPIRARNDTFVYRSGKFLRRHRWSAAAAALALIGLFGTTVLAVRQAHEAGLQRKAAEAARIAAQSEARRADQARDQAMSETRRANQAHRKAVREAQRAEAARAETALQAQRARDFAAEVAANLNVRLHQVPGALQARRELAQSTLSYLERLSKERPSDTRVQFDLARAHLTMAMVYYHIGNNSFFQFEPALERLESGRALAVQLRRGDPDKIEWKALQAALLNQTGLTLAGMGRWREAVNVFREREQFKEISAKEFTAIHYRRAPATFPAPLAEAMIALGDYRGAINLLPDGSAAKAMALAGTGDLNTGHQWLNRRVQRVPVRANTFVGIGVPTLDKHVLATISGHPLVLNLGDTETALLLTRQNIEVWEGMHASEPADGNSRQALATGYAFLGAVLRESSPDESVRAYNKAIQLWMDLLVRTPSNRNAQLNLASAHAGMALPLRKLAQAGRAGESLLSARRMEEALGEPRSFTRNELGDLELEAGNREKALEHYRAALQLAEKRIGERPQDMQARRELADTQEKLGQFCESSGQWQEAREWYGKSLTVWREWTKYGVSSPYNERREKQAADRLARLGEKR